MVVLAVTWMAKIGRESEVAAIFENLTAESRKEPGASMYQVHKHKTDPRRFFIYEQYRTMRLWRRIAPPPTSSNSPKKESA